MRSGIDIGSALQRAIGEADGGTIVSAYLFGSHAEDRAHRESDVDVGVLFNRRRLPRVQDRFEAGLRLSGLLQAELRTPRIDVVVLNDVPPGLGRKIVTAGRRLTCQDEEADLTFVRDVQLRAADLEPVLRRMRQIKLQSLAR